MGQKKSVPPMQARKLESDLESKLSAFSKLTNRLDSAGKGETGLAADQVSPIADLYNPACDTEYSQTIQQPFGIDSSNMIPHSGTLKRNRTEKEPGNCSWQAPRKLQLRMSSDTFRM